MTLSKLLITSSLALAMAACAGAQPSGPADDSRNDSGDPGSDPSCTSIHFDNVAIARELLLASEDFTVDDFVESSASEEPILDSDGEAADLNGDGIADMVVYPGIDYPNDNREAFIFLSDETTACVETYGGRLGGIAAIETAPSEEATAGYLVLHALNRSGPCTETTAWAFDAEAGEYMRAGAIDSDCLP